MGDWRLEASRWKGGVFGGVFHQTMQGADCTVRLGWVRRDERSWLCPGSGQPAQGAAQGLTTPMHPPGAMLGLCASVQPLLRTLGPTVGGFLYRSFGVPIFGHVQVAINVLVLLVLWRKPMPQRKDKVR